MRWMSPGLRQPSNECKFQLNGNDRRCLIVLQKAVISSTSDTLIDAMQALYALSTDAEAAASQRFRLTEILKVYGIIIDVIFDKADCSFLVFAGDTCIVYDRYGELVCQFIDEKAYRKPSLAFLPGNRIALAHRNSFAIWHLTPGHMLATITPQPSTAETNGFAAAGVVAADQTGSKLAFCSAAEPVLHVYNSTSLEELYRLEAAADIKFGAGSLYPDMVWTVYGWLLVGISRDSQIGVPSHVVHVMRPSETDSGKVCQLMQRRLQPEQLPATSPDSAFLCVFDNQSATLKVHDARTGRVVLSQPFVAVQDCTRQELMPDLTTKIWWTEDGRRLVVRVLMRSKDRMKTSQHIMMVQLGSPEWVCRI